MKKSSRQGLVRKIQPDSIQKTGVVLDRPINNEDIWVVLINGKKHVVGLSDVEKMNVNAEGMVLMRFIGGYGNNCEHY